jgi:lipooligosaccharide transport system ATP-binding protein
MDPTLKSGSIKRRLGVVTQENALDESLTVHENMRIYAKFEGVDAQVAEKRILSLLDHMNIIHKKDAPIQSLSGGMKRRLVFVRALLANPELLILDEPTTGLDPAVRHLLWGKVREMRSAGKTLLLTTHYMHEAEVLCDRLIILDQGKCVAEGSPQKLIREHSPGFVALFDLECLAALESLAAAHAVLQLTQDTSVASLRGPTFSHLVQFCEANKLTAKQIRPCNLEDVFLKLTGKGLSDDA